MRRTFLCLALLTAASPLLANNCLFANNWPNWRGPTFDGVAEGTGYPVEWSATKNVAWKVELPGKGSSTPVVWGDQIFLTCGDNGMNTLLAFNRQGKELWRTKIGTERPGKNKKASGSNPSCVTDGKHVFAYFKSGDLACVDLSGKIVWQTNLQHKYGEDTLWWDLGTSPVLTKAHCIVAVMQTGPSYLVAFEKESGKVAWKQDRNLGAPEEAAQSYSTPVVLTEDGQETLVVLGADHVTAHDAANGQEIWRVGGLNPTGHKYFRSIASPVVHRGIVVAPYARMETVTGIKLGGRGDVTSSHVVWTKRGNGSDVPTPAAADGRVYVLNDRGTLSCLEIASGRELWSGQPEKHRSGFSSSPILADGKIYITREDGKTFVLAQGDEFKVLAANELDGTQTVATPTFVDGRILIRTDTHLFCIGQ
jgi:outer membrane protein assembly factor BamB